LRGRGASEEKPVTDRLDVPLTGNGVHVQAEQRDGSTVRLVVDALRMLRDVLLVRR
jgi:hypothetical protein